MHNNVVTAVKPSVLLTELPSVPDWFRRELSNVASRNGKPMFRLVDGQRELKFRNGKMDVKHLVYHDQIPAYVPVVNEVFRRKNRLTGDWKLYASHKQAESDDNPDLWKPVDVARFVSTRAVGRACWIVEVYIAPEELGEQAWNESRFAELQTYGVYRKTDVLGPFPREGAYMYCFSVVDEDGNAISPNSRTIDECKKRWRQILGDNASYEQTMKDIADREAKHDQKQIQKISDNFYQFHGVTARRLHGGVISKPITKIYE